MVSTTTLTIADEGQRLRRYTRVLFAAVWGVPGAIAALQVYVTGQISGEPYTLATAIIWQGAAWGLWGLWSQVILTLVDRVPLLAGRMPQWLATHLIVCAALCTITVLAVGALDYTFAIWNGQPSYVKIVRSFVLAHLDFQFVLYWAVVGAAYMVEYVRRYRERDRAAQELEQKLARTQLEALRMQLNPHFLFNALNSVAELMEMDVREAQRTLTRVSDLLRLSLRSAASPTIPLWQEIELVELYLQIARIRFGDKLAVDIVVDPAAVDLEVPSFVLQPLVENALKHGLSPDSAGQSIDVSARRVGMSLELIVEDNGRGLDGAMTNSGRFMAARPSVDGLGIGLTNTRQRLKVLFGERYAFRMNNTAAGGCRVEIRLPLD
ncbi:MAG: histidine kinase [Phycisphaerae bacterium]|nr:histidine kinase [Gemmatimonadaceae bacterium]